MNTVAKTFAICFAAFVVCATAFGQVSLTTLGTPYTQDFNTLASTGTSSVVPTGWAFSETGTNANTLYAAGTGSSNVGDTYSFGAAANTERAFGGLRSGSLVPIIGASFTNNTGSTITSLLVSYAGEQWRLGTLARADRMDFQLSTNATSLITGTYTDYDNLDFLSPVTTGTVGALVGNDAANRTNISFTITGLNITDGSTFFIRWTDLDATGSDDGVSVDDFSLTPSGAVSLPSLSINDVQVAEGNIATTTASFTVNLSAPAGAGGVAFDIATQDNSATTANNDYVEKSLTSQTIPAGSSTYTFDVTVNGDLAVEPNETFFVNVTNVTGATPGDGQGIGTITNDDVAGVAITESGGSTNVTEGGATDTYTVVLNTVPASDVTISFNTGSQISVISSATFTPANALTPQTITVSAVDDAIVEGAHTGTISHSATSSDANYGGISIASLTANITDNDVAGVTITESGGSTNVTEGGATDTYTVVLNTVPTSDVTISFNTGSQISAISSATFTPTNALTPQTITVSAVDDAIAEGAHTGTISHSATSSDANYGGISIASVTANITDNDIAGVTITESGGSTNVTEGGATDTYTIVLNTVPTSDVTIAFNIGSQISAISSVTFTPANATTPQTITVSAVDDAIVEGAHTGTISHSATSSDANYNGISIASVMANITDNDVAPPSLSAVILATNSVWLQGSADIISGNVIVNRASSGPVLDSGVELSVGIGATTPAGYALKANRIKVKFGARVRSDVYYNQLTNNGSISGSQNSPLALPVVAALPPFHSAPAGTQNITVAKDGSVTIAAGAYRDIVVKQNGTLLFSGGGTFALRSVNAGIKTKLLFDAPTEILIEGKFNSDLNSLVGPTNGSGIGASDIVFYVAGVNGNNGNLSALPKAAQVGLNNTLLGNFYVPNGTLWLTGVTQATGAFYAKDVMLGIFVKVSQASAFNGSSVAKLGGEQVGQGNPISAAIPEEFGLMQNYPNPFNPTTTINYALPVDANVSLAMFNTLGQKVAQLVDARMNAGYHNVSFDAAALASGVYFYRLQTQTESGRPIVMMKKMILMK